MNEITWCESFSKMASQASVQECESYIELRGIQGILKECIAKICQERPAKPYKWLREYFEQLEKVRIVVVDLSLPPPFPT